MRRHEFITFLGGAGDNRRLEDLAHFQKQTLELARREIVDPLSWIDARLKQDIDQYRGI